MYPARGEKGRWRAVWYEDGQRQQCEGSSEDKLAAKPEKVTERFAAPVIGAVTCQDIKASHMQKIVNAAGTRRPAWGCCVDPSTGLWYWAISGYSTLQQLCDNCAKHLRKVRPYEELVEMNPDT